MPVYRFFGSCRGDLPDLEVRAGMHPLSPPNAGMYPAKSQSASKKSFGADLIKAGINYEGWGIYAEWGAVRQTPAGLPGNKVDRRIA